jgi:uncharacterized membrane protein
MMENSRKPSLVRLAYMILFLIIGRFVSVIIFFAAIFQLIYTWVYHRPNEQVLELTAALSEFAKQIIQFVAFNTENIPWPIGEWPKS